jgi:hypothetical protein
MSLFFPVLRLNPPQAIPGLWSFAHMAIPSTSSKLAQLTQNRSPELAPLLSLNSWQHTEGLWCKAQSATLSISLRSSMFSQSLQLSTIIHPHPGILPIYTIKYNIFYSYKNISPIKLDKCLSLFSLKNS